MMNIMRLALRFDGMSLKAYLHSMGMNGFIRKAIETAYLTEYGLETDVQSAINFLYLFSPDTSNGFDMYGYSDERYKIEGGNQTLTDKLYHKVKNKVNLEHQLVKIQQNIMGYSLYFTSPTGTTTQVNADIVIVAIPFSVLRKVQIDVAMPGK